MKEGFDALVGLIKELTWKRFLGLLLVIAIAVAGLAFYERFTNNFRLSRLQKEAEILSTLQDIERKGPIADPELSTIYSRIKKELEEASIYRPLTLKLTVALTSVSKFIAGAFLWLGFALFVFPSVLKGETNAWEGFVAILLLAIIFGVIGIYIPDQPQHIWIHYLLYPIGNFVLILTALLIAQWRWGTTTEVKQERVSGNPSA